MTVLASRPQRGTPEVVIELPGEPRGWGRTGVQVIRTAGGTTFAKHYTDPKTRTEQGALRWAARAAMRSCSPLDGPLVVRITACFTPPSSWSERKKGHAFAGLIRPSVKPDFDNIAKLVCDACNKLVWTDDARICEATTAKWYGRSPFLKIEVWRWTPGFL